MISSSPYSTRPSIRSLTISSLVCSPVCKPSSSASHRTRRTCSKTETSNQIGSTSPAPSPLLIVAHVWRCPSSATRPQRSDAAYNPSSTSPCASFPAATQQVPVSTPRGSTPRFCRLALLWRGCRGPAECTPRAMIWRHLCAPTHSPRAAARVVAPAASMDPAVAPHAALSSPTCRRCGRAASTRGSGPCRLDRPQGTAPRAHAATHRPRPALAPGELAESPRATEAPPWCVSASCGRSSRCPRGALDQVRPDRNQTPGS